MTAAPMAAPLIILRPKPGAGETLARIRDAGLDGRAFPLFAVQPVAHDVPDAAAFDALLVTSANGARHGADVLAALAHLPVFVVGEASGRAARAAGAAQVTAGEGDAARTIPLILAAGHRRLLHIGGADLTAFDPLGLDVTRLTVYRAEPADDAPLCAALAALPRAVILVHSPRAGRRLAGVVTVEDRARFALVAISPAAAQAAGEGWAERGVASEMNDKAMLALAIQLCHYGHDKTEKQGDTY